MITPNTLYYFRAFCDTLVRPEDSEIIANVSCLTILQDSPLATMMESDTLEEEDEYDPELPHATQLKKALKKNIEVRASTSLDSIQSYESIKAEKHFLNPLNVRYVNNAKFTALRRAGTNVCCYFQDKIRY